MSTVTAPRPRPRRARVPPDPQRLLLYSVPWDSYEQILEALDDRHLRITYDHGALEIMTLSPEHERNKILFRRLIEELCDTFDLAVAGLGSTTYRRREHERGLEPDECYYFGRLDRIRGLKRIDLRVDPPPELVLEIDVTRSCIDRMEIYASIGVKEVWTFDGDTLQMFRLNPHGEYELATTSELFPGIPLGELVRFVKQGWDEEDTSMIRAFRAWLRKLQAKRKRTGRR